MTTQNKRAANGCPFSAQASSFDMFGSGYQCDPSEALRFARDGEPIFYSEAMGYWIVTRYDDVKAIFRDPITYSAYNVLEKLTPAPPAAQAILRSYNYAMDRTLVNEVEPVHMERRRLLLDAFAPTEIEKLRSTVLDLVQQKIDGFIGKGRADLVAELLWDIPLTTALSFLGVPDEDKDVLRKFSVAHTVNTWGRPTPQEQIGVAEAVGQFWDYSGKVLAKMKANPNGEGWMYDMIAKNRIEPEIVTDNFLHSMMMAIIVAAHETTALASANALKVLLSQPDMWRKLCDNPMLVPGAVEECLRHSGSVVAWRRQTTREVTIGGVTIPEGAKLFVATASANHDPRHFENPDEVDIYRDNASEHLTFGYGAHQCMGKNIARMEICVLIEALVRRIPGLRLADQTFSYLPNTSFRGPEAVWVEWDLSRLPPPAAPSVFPIGVPEARLLARPMIVAEVAAAASDVVTATFKPVPGEALPSWSPGSHIELIVPGVGTRKYSLCGRSGSDGYVVAIQREDGGRGGSLWLHRHLRPGMEIAVRGPKNFFRFDPEAPFHLLIAGGIGITPILAMADALRAVGKPYRLIYLGRERSRLALLDRVEDHGPVAYVHVSSEHGRLELHGMLASLSSGTQICACGPESLLDELAVQVAERDDISLRVEHFGGSAPVLDTKSEQPFDVELLSSGITLTVQRDRTLLDTLLAAGLDVAHDCCEGLCGSCEVEVSEGTVDHRDRVLSAKERDQQDRMMACCSRGKGPIKLKL